MTHPNFHIPAEGFCPGAGVLAVHVTDAYDFRSTLFEGAVKRSVPVETSFGRPSVLFTKRTVTLVYSAVHAAVDALYRRWNARMGRKDKAPIVNRSYMERWFTRMQMDKDETLALLGVAQPGDTFDLATTPRAGRKVVVTTFENRYGEAFARRHGAVRTEELKPSALIEVLTDATILTALARFNRRLMYEQLCRACGWVTLRTDKHTVETLVSGIDLDRWCAYSQEVRTADGAIFLLPFGKDSWVVCQSPEGEENVPVRWRVIRETEESPLPVLNTFHTRVSVTCMPLEHRWTAEYNKDISIKSPLAEAIVG